MEAPDLVVTAYGEPVPQGSKTAFAHRRKAGGEWVYTGSASVVEGRTRESREAFAAWRETVRQAAAKAVDGREPLAGPLAVSMTFAVRRPKLPARQRIGGQLVPVRHYPCKRPDLGKYARAVEDSLTLARAWADDAQIVHYLRLAKFYTGDWQRYGEPDVLDAPGVVVRVWLIGPERPQELSGSTGTGDDGGNGLSGAPEPAQGRPGRARRRA